MPGASATFRPTPRPTRPRVFLAAASAAWFAAACVTTYEQVEPAAGGAEVPLTAPVSIPLTDLARSGSSRVEVEFFSGILRRLQDAAEEARRSPESALPAAALICPVGSCCFLGVLALRPLLLAEPPPSSVPRWHH